MKLLFVIDSLGTGGAERSTANIWYFLRDRGVSLKILALRKRKEGIQQEILDAGFDVEFLNGLGFLKQVLRIASTVRYFQPDVMHSILFSSNLRCRAARILRKFTHLESLVNEVYSPHRFDDPNVVPWKLNAWKRVDCWSSRFGVDHFHANGQSVARHYVNNVMLPPNCITVVPRGREPNRFVGGSLNRDEVRSEVQCGEKVLLIQVGRHEYQKAHDELLDAISGSEILRQHTHLLLLGRAGSTTKLIESKILQASMKNVSMLGHRSDIARFLAAADICVHPSRFEGLPGTLIEAEAAGLPIVCSAIPNNLEVVDNSLNSLTFEPGDISHLRRHLEDLVRDPERRKLMGQKSLSIFQSRFDLEKIHLQMLQLYQRLAAGIPVVTDVS